MQNPIQATDLSRSFGDLVAVDGISLSVERVKSLVSLDQMGPENLQLFGC